MSVADEIDKLNALRQTGAISEDEYQSAKTTLLEQLEAPPLEPLRTAAAEPFDVNTWVMWVHFSHFCGLVVPVLGFVVPYILWQLKKDDHQLVDIHGRIVMNWCITLTIVLLVTGTAIALLNKMLETQYFVYLTSAIYLVDLLFTVMGGLKAQKGEIWSYPLAIKFLPEARGRRP